MSAARDSFVDRISAYATALRSPELTSTTLTPAVRADSSRLFRNGLIIVGYAIFEDFVRTRTSELLARLTDTQLSFSELPEKLQYASSLGAVTALQYRANIERDPGRRLSMIQGVGRQLASTGEQRFELPPLGLGSRGANLSPDDISNILGSFALKGGWRLVQTVAARVGGASPDVQQSLKQAFESRNLAAHEADAVTQVTDLDSFRKNAIAAAIGIDALLSRGCRRLLTRRHGRRLKTTPIESPGIRLRFVDLRNDGRWHERLEAMASGPLLRAAPAVTASTDFASARNTAQGRAERARQVLVARGRDGIPTWWRPTDLD